MLPCATVISRQYADIVRNMPRYVKVRSFCISYGGKLW